MKKSIYFTLLFYVIPIFIFAQTGVIKGKIVNSKNNESLAFVSVAIQGSTTGVTTDINGNYEIKNLLPGLYNLSASFIGFETHTVYEISVTNAKPAEVNFSLIEKVKKLKEVEIKAEVFERNDESPISLRTIGVSEIQRNPGGNRDISKVLQSLPGVAPTVSYRNDIVIRGGAPNENRFYLDGIEVPNINHFATQGSSGGPVGMINVDFIREVDFYSSAFPANRNNALSSIMDFKLADGRSDKTGGKFTIGASDIGLSLEGPANKNATFLVSVRRSYLQFLFKIIGLPFLPVYNDFQVKYKWKINVKNEITFIGLGAIDNSSLNTSLQETGTQQQKYILGYLPASNQWNYVNGVKYVHFEKNGFTTMVLSRNMLNNQSVKYVDNIEIPANKILDYKSWEIENKFRIEHTVIKNDFKFNYGTNFEFAKYTNSTFNKITTPAGIDTINFSSNLDLLKWGLFGQVSKSFLDSRLGISFGIRTDGNNYDESMINLTRQLSPRISFSYSITPEFSVNANTGYYYQLPAYTVLGYRNSSGELLNKNNNVKYIRARHYVAGLEYLTKKNLKINIEGFLKYFDQYPFLLRDSISLANLGSDFGVIGNEEVVSTSKGRSYGIEFLLQQKLYKGFYGLLTYTYVRSEFIDKHNNWIPSAWDNRHIVNITLGKSFSKNWELGAKWRFGMGTPYTPYNIEESRSIVNWTINQHGIYDYNLINTKRLKAFHQLDVRVDKKYYYKKFSMNFYIDIQNVYNFQTDSPPILDIIRDSNNKIAIDPSDPTKYQTVLLNNYSGSILPTIGVIIEF
jgi:outer membrane receptor for ferrienterochelin and colicin